MRRPLGKTGLSVSPVALGCWPIAGMTTLGANRQDSIATIQACLEVGVNLLDLAYAYGADGESERLVGDAIQGHRHEFVLASKGGVHWNPDGTRGLDARPERLQQQLHASLARLKTDRIDLYYLHAPDPQVPLEESAGALREFQRQGLTGAVGASNLTLKQLRRFHAVCPLAACQPPYNMLQRQVEADILPWCQQHHVAVLVYWPLMKGLLAGRLGRDHRFAPGDSRATYPMFQGRQWQLNQDFLDDLHELAASTGRSVAQIVINWTIHQPGVTAALCGAKRAGQIRENAGAMGWELTPQQRDHIATALRRRGTAVVGSS